MMKSHQLTAAIIGTGQIAGGFDERKIKGARGVFSHAGAFKAGGKIRLVTVFDRDRGKAARFARTWKAKAVSSLPAITSCYHDIVVVSTPDNTHFAIAKAFLRHKSCRTLCVEKPAATAERQLKELIRLARRGRIHVYVNFQRRLDPVHIRLAERLRLERSHILAVQGLYIKSLDHNGVTMADTLRFLLGDPVAVQALRRVGQAYDFILFYPTFAVTVRTADSPKGGYHYHIFEIDMLLDDRRLTLIDNSRALRESHVERFAYSGVKGLGDVRPVVTPTGYAYAMKTVATYLARITRGLQKHTVNTLESSLVNARLIEAVKKSFSAGRKKVAFNGMKK